MKRQRKLAVLATGCLVVLMVVTQTVLAGASLDYGTLTGTPAGGTVTYVAYLTKTNGDEILTEDGYTSLQGPDKGYQSGFWFLGVENFDNEAPDDEVQIYFTGIGAEEGKAGNLTFNWATGDDYTGHPEVAFAPGENPATPTDLVASPAGEQIVQLMWTDHTGGAATYRLYRSTQPGSPDHDTSNGHYYRISPFNYDCSAGICTGLDDTAVAGKNWYIVVAEGSLSGHSNESWTVPVAVKLVAFTASPTEEGILLDWETANEIDLAGFNLYRAEDPNGQRALLNDTLVPPQVPGEPTGAVYTWLDEGPLPGVTYYYWLEDVDIYGTATLHGPVSAKLEVVVPMYPVYLPFITRGW